MFPSKCSVSCHDGNSVLHQMLWPLMSRPAAVTLVSCGRHNHNTCCIDHNMLRGHCCCYLLGGHSNSDAIKASVWVMWHCDITNAIVCGVINYYKSDLSCDCNGSLRLVLKVAVSGACTESHLQRLHPWFYFGRQNWWNRRRLGVIFGQHIKIWQDFMFSGRKHDDKITPKLWQRA